MAYLPSLSVFASCFTPWSLTARTVRPAQGFAFRSKITPLIDPVCAEAPGARTETNAPTISAADAKKLSALFMPISPFNKDEAVPLAGVRLLSPNLAGGQAQGFAATVRP